MHQKEKVMGPILEKELGVNVVVPENFDTDRFGTFTKEVARAGNQLEAARSKALAAMKLLKCDLGVASEGSFGTHPSMPFIQSNLEIVLLLDLKNGLEIIGHHRSSEVKAKGKEVSSVDEAVKTALQWGFPLQGVIVRLSQKHKKHIYKEVRTLEELRRVSDKLLSKWLVKSIFLETDMRAHRSPARMKAIELATKDLVNNCQSFCPRCEAPGFVVTNTTKGLPCSNCHLPTDVIKEKVFKCNKCNHEEYQPITDREFADPAECERCNP